MIIDGITPIDSKRWPKGEEWNILRYMVDACHDASRPDLIGKIKIEFADGMKTVIARASFRENKIWISRRHWPYMPEFEKRDTIIHEVCHIVCPGRGHGRQWRDAMERCGGYPRRTMSIKSYRSMAKKRRAMSR